jgi:hypothetical protein
MRVGSFLDLIPPELSGRGVEVRDGASWPTNHTRWKSGTGRGADFSHGTFHSVTWSGAFAAWAEVVPTIGSETIARRKVRIAHQE